MNMYCLFKKAAPVVGHLSCFHSFLKSVETSIIVDLFFKTPDTCFLCS